MNEDLAASDHRNEASEHTESIDQASATETKPAAKAIGLDIGFGYVKVVSGSGMKKFPSIFAPELFVTNKIKTRKVMEYEDKKYVVGDDADDIADVTRLQTVEDIIKWAPLFAAYAIKHVPERQRICIGLPVQYVLRNKELVEELKGSLRNFRVNGLTYKFDVIAMAQGIGAYNDYHRKNEAEYVVVDIGYNTLDLVYVRDGKPDDARMKMNKGINVLIGHVIDYIQNEYGATISAQKAQYILETGTYIRKGQTHKLDKVVEDLATAYTASVINEALQEKWKNELRDDVSKVVIVGGGANYVRRDNLSEDIRDMVFIPNNPEFANARGFYRRAQKM
jgi:actin-like ATPase involved in cell morphogenesis